MEQWADSITAVLDDLGSTEAVLLAAAAGVATGALFAANISVSHHRAGRARRLRRYGRHPSPETTLRWPAGGAPGRSNMR